MFEHNNNEGLDGYQSRSGDEAKPYRWRGRPHQQSRDPPAQMFPPTALDLSDPMLCHMIGVAREMAHRNIAGEVPTRFPASW